MNLVIDRKDDTSEETLGELSIENKFFSYTLELPEGKEGETKQDGIDRGVIICIPKGNYKVKVTYSKHMQKRLPLIYNDDNTLSIITPIGTWEGARFHGGNTYLDSLGCILVAKNQYENKPSVFLNKEGHIIENWIQGSMSQELTVKLDDGRIHNLVIQ